MITLGFETPPRKVLCLGAHPDDIEMGAGGTLALLAGRDSATRFQFVIATGSGARADEGTASASALLGDRVELAFGGFTDGYLPYRDSGGLKDFIRDAVDTSDLDLVIGPHTGDWHQDHRFVAELAHQLFRKVMILEYEIVKLEGDLGQPGVYVPLTSNQAMAKLDHLEGHFASQHHKIWYDRETLGGLLRIRGVESLAPEGYAEAFHARRLAIA